MTFDYKSVYFPYDKVRDYQDRLIHGVINALDSKKVLIAHAPTGLGKTASVLAPALTHALKTDSTVFFLTPRHTQHKLVIETLKLIKKKFNLNFLVTDLIGKKWMCPQEASKDLSTSEFMDYCRDLRSEGKCHYYGRTKSTELSNASMNFIKQLSTAEPMHVDEFVNECAVNKLCPPEIAEAVGKSSKVIVCDYYHLFNKSIRNTFLSKLNKELSKSVIIVDEAHNLPDRVRDLMTYQLSTFTINSSIKELRELSYDDEAELVSQLGGLFALGDTVKESVIKRDEFIKSVESVTKESYDDLIEKLLFASEEVREERKKSFTHAIASFLESWKGGDESFARIMKSAESQSGRKFSTLTYYCLDPALFTSEVFSECESAVLMSGTLTPTDMYKELLGIKEPMILELKSPFPPDNRLTIIDTELTSKYSGRSRETYELMAKKINGITSSNKTNTLVFFPSYEFMMSVLPYYNRFTNRELIVEQRGLCKDEKDSLLNHFKSQNTKGGAVLFGVVGGNFSEGIDLPGTYLECVVIVGVPLSPPDLYSKSLINYYDDKFGKGWDYGYIFPAITKVVQGAGRCIRTETDRGAIVLLDERYAWKNYLKIIPPEWDVKITRSPFELINSFFN